MNTPVCCAGTPLLIEGQGGSARVQRLARHAMVALVLLSGTVAALAWQARLLQDGPPRAALGQPEPNAPRWPAEPLPVLAPAAARQPVTPAAQAAAAPPPATSRMSLDARGWTLQAQGVPRGQLVQQLAGLSGNTLNVVPSLLQGTAPVSLQGHGLSLAQAWQAVLGDDFSHALLCDGRQCHVWITSALGRHATPPGAAQAPGTGHSASAQLAATAPRVFTSDPPGLFTSTPADADTEQTAGRASGA